MGKTTLLFRLQLDEPVETVPTIAFNVECVVRDNIRFQVWDLGGQRSIRPYWRCYMLSTAAVIFVVDATDHERIDLCAEELYFLCQEEGLENAVILIFANKQDLVDKNPMNSSELMDKLKLFNIKNKSWNIFNTSALTGDGIKEGVDWLCNEIISRKP